MAPRQAERDITIDGIFIPKGTSVMLCPSVANLHPKLWGPDPSVFDPDRWLPDRLVGDTASPFVFCSFIQGPRMCIGRQFAMLEFKSLLIELVSRWRFGSVEGFVINLENPSLTLRPRGGLKVMVERLQ
jgi:cytochrome P450